MKFLIINEGSRGEIDSYVGGLKNIDELVDSWYEERKNLVLEGMSNEFMDLQFGGIVDKKAFLELSFDEEDNYLVYLIQDGKIDSDEYRMEGFIDYGKEEMINNPESFRYEFHVERV